MCVLLPSGETRNYISAQKERSRLRDRSAEAGLPINPEGDQEADPGPDIEEVTPGTEGAQEVLPIHVLLEGVTQAGSPGHNPEPDPGPGLGLTGEDQGLIPTPSDQDQNQGQGQDQDPREDIVFIPEAIMIQDFQTTIKAKSKSSSSLEVSNHISILVRS